MVGWWRRGVALAYKIALGVCLAAVVTGCGTEANAGGSTIGAYTFGDRTKTSHCVANGGLPDHACTPGDIFTDATK